MMAHLALRGMLALGIVGAAVGSPVEIVVSFTEPVPPVAMAACFTIAGLSLLLGGAGWRLRRRELAARALRSRADDA